MAIKRLTLVRTRAGRKPQNVDLDTVKQMTDIWSGDEDTITEAFGEFDTEADYSVEGLSDGVSYTDRQSAQKVAQAYKGYLEKHNPELFEQAGMKLAAVTGKNPDGEGFVFSLNPEEDTDTTIVKRVENEDENTEETSDANAA